MWVEVSVVVVEGREACAPAMVESESAESVERVRKEEGRMLDVACVRNVRIVVRSGARARRCVAAVRADREECGALFCFLSLFPSFLIV